MKKKGCSSPLYFKLIQSFLLLISLAASGAVSADSNDNLVYSLTSDRAGNISLQGATVSGNIYGRLAQESSDIEQVRFYQDGARRPFRTENYAPYDLKSSLSLNSPALPYDTTELRDGNHSIRTEVDRRVSYFFTSTSSFNTNFIVDNSGSTDPTGPQRVSVSINHGNDDVEEKENTGSIYFGSSDLELVYDSYNNQKRQTIGLRFNDIEVPKGAYITNAFLEFAADETDTATVNLNIFGQAADNAQAFSSNNFNVSSRARTSANTAWTPDGWTSVGQQKFTPSISGIVQEIVNRAGWQSNNSMVFIITGNGENSRVADSYNGSTSRAPKLVIEYETDVSIPNRAPVLNNIAGLSLEAGTNQSVALSAYDVDGDDISFSISTNTNFVTLTDNGNGTASLQVSPALTDAGNYTVSVFVNDGSLNDSQNVPLVVTEAVVPNQAPTLSAISDLSFVAGTTQSLTFSANDVDGDSLSFSINGNPNFGTFTDNGDGTASLQLSPSETEFGSSMVTISVSDGELSANQSFQIVVTEPVIVNQAPTIEPLTDLTIEAGSSETVTIVAADIDGDMLSFTITGNPSFGSFTDNADGTASLLLDPTIEDAGEFTVTVSVSDGELSTSTSFLLTVTYTPVSVLPVIELTAPLIVDEPKNPGTFRLVSDAFEQDTGVLSMGIEFRGATSQIFDKKAFSLELVEDDDPTDELKKSLLDLRKDGDWILDAAYRDTSFVRNIVGHDLFNDMRPFAFIDEDGDEQGQATIRGHLSEVFLNGSYHGVYILSEKVDRKLLDLKKIDVPEDADGNDLFDQIDFTDPDNGSVLYKADSNFATLDFLATVQVDFEQKYPDVDDVARWEPLEELISFITTATDEDFVAGIGEIIDIDSVVDYWLLINVISDTDSFKKNYYLARSGPGKFFFVPWDNDASFSMWWDGSRVDWTFAYWAPEENALIRRLINLPQTGFNTKVKQRWSELKTTLYTQQALTGRFEAYHSLLDTEDADGETARERNLVRWPNSGDLGSANPELGTAAFISSWIADRLALLDGLINGLAE